MLGRPGAVYANGSSLYIASRHYRHMIDQGWWFEQDDRLKDATSVHRFHLSNDEHDLRYLGSGAVKGRILNQFSLDEHQGDLRIATTTGRLPDLETHNTLSILRASEGALVEIGRIDDIAPTEDIRAVRFDSDVGYVVTFKKTDPLFVFDLAEPTDPTIQGELKIPGFSTYMHRLDDDHLLTIGFDADDQGDFAYFTGVQLQIIDVADMQNPNLIHKEVIGTRGSTSDAATNHLAFNYYGTRDMLALPMMICEGEAIFDAQMTFNGLLVYDVTAERGFSQLGGIQSGPVESDGDEWGACSSWWTRGDSKVDRSVFMEDYVYAISKELINVASTNKLDEVLAEVELARR